MRIMGFYNNSSKKINFSANSKSIKTSANSLSQTITERFKKMYPQKPITPDTLVQFLVAEGEPKAPLRKTVGINSPWGNDDLTLVINPERWFAPEDRPTNFQHVV